MAEEPGPTSVPSPGHADAGPPIVARGSETEAARLPGETLTRGQVRRLLRRSLLRSVGLSVLLLGLYFLLPLQLLGEAPLGLSLPLGLVLFTTVAVWQVRAVARAPYPAIRAVEGLAATLPLFLVLFAAIYVIMSSNDPANFDTSSLSRIDGLYFTVTVFASVGFGDITATSQTARVVVMVQMILDLGVLGLGVRLLAGAVDIGRRRRSTRRDDVSAGDDLSPGTG